MKKRSRLTRQSDFQRVLASPRLYAGRGLVAFGVAGEGSTHRVGVAVSRRLRGAVRRNRARRRVREAARLGLSRDSAPAGRGIAFDVVLIARPAALDLPFEELRSEAGSAFERVGVGRR